MQTVVLAMISMVKTSNHYSVVLPLDIFSQKSKISLKPMISNSLMDFEEAQNQESRTVIKNPNQN